MLDIIKKSYLITKNNSPIILFWILYLLVMPICSSVLLRVQGTLLLFFTLFLLILLNVAFFSGWFKMIKQAIKNSEKNYLIEDEKYKDILDLRISFFEAIPEYMLPLLSIFAIYYFAFLAWVMTTIKLAEKFIGKIDFLLENLKTIQVSTASALEYIQNLPTEQLKILYEWQTFLILSIAIFGIFTLFLPPALYFEKNNKKNPLRAFLNSFKVFFKKPVEIIIFNVVIGILFFIMMLLQALCSANLVLYFFYFLISTWLTTYFVVLLFNYYDKRFAYNSNNRADSFREN